MSGAGCVQPKTHTSPGPTPWDKHGQPMPPQAALTGGRGRPSSYTDQLAEAICTRIACGEPLRNIVKDDAMPPMSVVFRWLSKREDFAEMYTRAKQESADTLADDLLAISDDPTLDPNDKRVRIDTRKWIAAKLKPRKYGDRLEIDQQVNHVTISLAQALDAADAREARETIDITPHRAA